MPKSIDHQVVRHAYENALSACARLSAYATATPTQIDDSLVDNRQTVLAADDLVNFSINARRLMDNVDSLDHFQQYLVKSAYNGTLEDRPVTRIINVTVHHNYLKIRRFKYEMDELSLTSTDAVEHYRLIMDNRIAISPHVFVESDNKNKMVFEIINLTKCFEENVLPDVIKMCADQRLHLDDDE